MNEEEWDAHEEADAADDDVRDAKERVLATEDGGVGQNDAFRPGKFLHLITCSKDNFFSRDDFYTFWQICTDNKRQFIPLPIFTIFIPLFCGALTLVRKVKIVAV